MITAEIVQELTTRGAKAQEEAKFCALLHRILTRAVAGESSLLLYTWDDSSLVSKTTESRLTALGFDVSRGGIFSRSVLISWEKKGGVR